MGLGERVDAAVDAALGQRIVGCVILIKRDGEEIYARAAGLADREANVPMRREAIFRHHLMRVREYSEAIALDGGADVEGRQLDGRFGAVPQPAGLLFFI